MKLSVRVAGGRRLTLRQLLGQFCEIEKNGFPDRYFRRTNPARIPPSSGTSGHTKDGGEPLLANVPATHDLNVVLPLYLR